MYHNTTPQERGIRNPNHPSTAAAPPPPSGTTYGQSPASGPAPTTAGHHKHDALNKLDPRIDSTHDHQSMPTTTSGKIPEGTYGPHRSRVANALDPRVDSDLDSGRAGAGTGPGGGLGGGQAQPTAATATGMGMGAAGGGGGMMHGGAVAPPQGPGQGRVAAEGTYGPHHSRVANAADPRVDSDRDRHLGSGGGGGGGMMGGTAGAAPVAGHYQGGGATHAGMTGPGGAAGVSAPHTTGPHKSDLLNKLDPRVDSKTGTYKDTAGTRGAY
ncbi:uncharacterized protein B0H64DRAFT_444340 [Chaetomium fimeti]|uniref:Uncharacterized protein n=1 Tax=Chaetomium fimeti TaxID=1854472 RepID=A0AAE0HAM3_9PEZI|nr:hypothetical protein B0H64DRAFT_444340 [Chaetomium fimeti]